MKASIIVISPELGKRYKLALSQEMLPLITARHAREHILKATPDIPSFVLLFNSVELADDDKIGYTNGQAIYLKITEAESALQYLNRSSIGVSRLAATKYAARTPQRGNLSYILNSFEDGTYYKSPMPVYYDAEVGQRIQHLKQLYQNIKNMRAHDEAEYDNATALSSAVEASAAVDFYRSNTPAITDAYIAQAVYNRLNQVHDAAEESPVQSYPPRTPQTVVYQSLEPQPQPMDSPPTYKTITLTKRNITPLLAKLPPKPSVSETKLDEFQVELEQLRRDLQQTKEQYERQHAETKTTTNKLFETVQQKLSYVKQIRSQRESQMSDKSSLMLSEVHGARENVEEPAQSSTLAGKEDSSISDKLDQLAEQQRKHEEYLRLYQEQQQIELLQKQNLVFKEENNKLEAYLRFLKHYHGIHSQDFANSNQLRNEVQGEIRLYKQQARDICLQQDKRESFELALLVEKLHQVVVQKEDAVKAFQEKQQLRQALHNQLEDLKGNIRVFVRIRPVLRNEQNLCKNIPVKVTDYLTVSNEQKLRIKLPYSTSSQSSQEFNFYRIYDGAASQKSVFSDVQPLLLSALDGYNLTLLCYGVTGSGKTFTMIGDDGDSDVIDGEDAYARLGILPRAVVYLFEQIDMMKLDCTVEIAMVELYCDQLVDLLPARGAEGVDLKIRFQSGNYFIYNLDYHPAKTANELIQIIADGLEKRHIGSTKLNERSSRSHAIIYLRLLINNRRSVIIFGDLAGSERVEKSQSDGQRLKEAQFINSSLSALGDVVSALSRKNPHIPFRNSKLTEILQPGLGGNSKCLVLVNISPLWQNLHESFNSIIFANQVKSVKNEAIRGIFE